MDIALHSACKTLLLYASLQEFLDDDPLFCTLENHLYKINRQCSQIFLIPQKILFHRVILNILHGPKISIDTELIFGFLVKLNHHRMTINTVK